MRSFITGIDGFIGSWLADTLVLAGDEVVGLSRSQSGTDAGVTRLRGDLSAKTDFHTIVSEARPDRIFHLASLNNINDSFADPQATIDTNVAGSVRLFDAVRAVAPRASLVSVGSSSEYGRTASQLPPLSEEVPLLPTSPYGISKVSQGQFARVYAAVYGLKWMHVRPFAVIGPKKTRDALSDFCRNVVALERGETDKFMIGNLTSERDFIDVRDCVAALILVSEKGEGGATYNLCNGQLATLQGVIEMMRKLSHKPFEPTPDPSRMRPADDPRILGDASRLHALGYAPRHSLGDTVSATLSYWRAFP